MTLIIFASTIVIVSPLPSFFIFSQSPLVTVHPVLIFHCSPPFKCWLLCHKSTNGDFYHSRNCSQRLSLLQPSFPLPFSPLKSFYSFQFSSSLLAEFVATFYSLLFMQVDLLSPPKMLGVEILTDEMNLIYFKLPIIPWSLTTRSLKLSGT